MDWIKLKQEWEKGNVEVVEKLLRAVLHEGQYKQRDLNSFGGR